MVTNARRNLTRGLFYRGDAEATDSILKGLCPPAQGWSAWAGQPWVHEPHVANRKAVVARESLPATLCHNTVGVVPFLPTNPG
jgi:hypothetical protein